MFQLRNLMWDNRKKVRIFAHFVLIFNTVSVGYKAYEGEFEWNSLDVNLWLIAFFSFISISIMYREED